MRRTLGESDNFLSNRPNLARSSISDRPELRFWWMYRERIWTAYLFIRRSRRQGRERERGQYLRLVVGPRIESRSGELTRNRVQNLL